MLVVSAGTPGVRGLMPENWPNSNFRRVIFLLTTSNLATGFPWTNTTMMPPSFPRNGKRGFTIRGGSHWTGIQIALGFGRYITNQSISSHNNFNGSFSIKTSTAKFLWAAQTKKGTAYKLMKLHKQRNKHYLETEVLYLETEVLNQVVTIWLVVLNTL